MQKNKPGTFPEHKSHSSVQTGIFKGFEGPEPVSSSSKAFGTCS